MQIQCPKCKNWTDAETEICTFCGESLFNEPPAVPSQSPEELARQKKKAYELDKPALVFGVFIIIVFIIGCIGMLYVILFEL